MSRQNAKLMLPVLLDDANLGRTDALIDTVELVRMTPAIAITTSRAAGTVSTSRAATTEGPRRSTALSRGTILRRA